MIFSFSKTTIGSFPAPLGSYAYVWPLVVSLKQKYHIHTATFIIGIQHQHSKVHSHMFSIFKMIEIDKNDRQF